MWEAYQLSSKLRIRPSELYSIEEPVAALNFDKAVVTFGAALEEAIRKKTKKVKDQDEAERKAHDEVQRWISSADPVDSPSRNRSRFRDPMAGM